MDGGAACTPMRLRADMTVKDLKAVAAVCCGILSEKKKTTDVFKLTEVCRKFEKLYIVQEVVHKLVIP